MAMRTILTGLAGAAAFVSASSANAATLFVDDNSLNNMVHAFSDATHPDTGSTVYGITDDENELVAFTSDQTIHITGGSGYASISDPIDLTDWEVLDIALDSYPDGFSALAFSIMFNGDFVGNGNGPQPGPGFLTVSVDLLGGGTQTFTYDASFNDLNDSLSDLAELSFPNQGLKDFLITAGPGEVFTAVHLTGSTPFFEVKQVDIDLATGAVPEPASWAMLLAGFGLVGGAMRRRTRTKITYA